MTTFVLVLFVSFCHLHLWLSHPITDEIDCSRGLQRDVVNLGCPIAPSYMSPNEGGGGSCGVSANEYSCTQQVK
jgi:hypothetical protein